MIAFNSVCRKSLGNILSVYYMLYKLSLKAALKRLNIYITKKIKVFQDRHLAQWLRCGLGYLHTVSQCLHSSSTSACLPSRPCRWGRQHVMASLLGSVLCTWETWRLLQPGWALAVMGIQTPAHWLSTVQYKCKDPYKLFTELNEKEKKKDVKKACSNWWR